MTEMAINRPNKTWEVLWKLNQVAVPVLLAWGVWVTSQTFDTIGFKNRGDRFTNTNGLELKLAILEKIDSVEQRLRSKDVQQDEAISSAPSNEWKSRIVLLETMAKENRERLIRIEAAVTKP
jgi:hypothetical protein